MLSRVEDGEKAPLAAILGVAGEALSADEKAFFKDADPLGFILFARNCSNPAQLRALTDSLRDCLGREAPVLIDQEGGRVQRLKPPHWGAYKPAREFGDLFQRDFSAGKKKLEEQVAAIAAELRAGGIDVNCAPVLDLLYPQTDVSIGDRAFSANPEIAGVLGMSACAAYLAAGIIPVIKHLPGLGRADLDTHKDLPAVEAGRAEMKRSDFLPFKEIMTKAFSEAVWGMVGHALYREIDERAPASCSRRVIDDVIRGDIGFDGLLLSDDLSMGALGTIGDSGLRAEKVLRAGCDIALHCNGKIEEMQGVARRIERMTSRAVSRYNRSVSWIRRNFKDDSQRQAV